MTDILENLKNRAAERGSQKKGALSGGTVAFLLFNVLLILGFCKFSFYVLKNHRSAIERDTLIKTYVDVQPYTLNKKSSPAYFALNTADKEAPSPFFIEKETLEVPQRTALSETAPLPILDSPQKTPKQPIPVKTVSRPPVIRPIAQASVINDRQSLLQESPTEEEKTGTDMAGISLDTLMESGLSLLETSEESAVASELLLQEEIPPFSEQNLWEKEAFETSAVTEKAIEKTTEPPAAEKIVKKSVQKKKDKNATRWLDVAELRRQLSDLTAPVISKQEEISRQNTALLEMNGAKQVAALNTKTESDAKASPSINNEEISPAVISQEAAEETKENASLIKNDGHAFAASEKTRETVLDVPSVPVQTAVVQDIPFAGTAQTPDTPQKTESSDISKKHHAALAGNSPNLWKVAKVKSPSKNALTVQQDNESDSKPVEKKIAVSETISPSPAKSEMIYRNGRPIAAVQNQEKKSLNWLDRQEAAVWTSMSQSDTPSVWSSAAETDPAAADRAKAFRVADEQPAQEAQTNVVNSAPVRIVGEETQPEAKENPLLLPLGTPAVQTRTSAASGTPAASVPALPLTAAGVSPTITPAVNPNGFTSPASMETKGQQAEEEGLMNKIFSFFGKNDSGELPNIGSGTPVKTDQKKETDKTAAKASQSQENKQTKESPVAQQTANKQIVPTELRLTFKPNSAEMSSQSIKWIKAFGLKAKKDIQNAVEVRMSNMDPALQNKRFAMIRNTLIGTGLEEVQILPVMTDRTPHTIVLRMIVLPEEGYTEYTTENGGVKERLYYKQW
ncbi:MAG: hypothetical protein IJ752_03630 [Alphaproteobacteria bacterium]|nr:hypothetical protein [Alphaproteobacteria bacterium]